MHAQERIRPPAVAGMFYTGEPKMLSAEVNEMLAGANRGGELPQMPLPVSFYPGTVQPG
jgi:predicted class III extradiol MEMO1 family dioxygenase